MSSQSQTNLRKGIFESINECFQNYFQGCPMENISHTRRLMTALSEFYRIPKSKDNLITRENLSQYELQIVSAFRDMRFPFSMDSICLTQEEDFLRNMAKGFAALRIEIIPQLQLNHQEFNYYCFHRICQFEEVIREELFRRTHLIEINENEEKSNADEECCNCNDKRPSSWKRESDGKLKCNWCFLIKDRFKIDRELPYRMLTINGAPKKYYNLIAQLKEEYSLTD